MQKKNTLGAISYKTRRVKFGGNWFAVDPFQNLDQLTVGKEYDVEFKTDNGVFYIDNFKEVTKV